jgi:hypothetical protein
MGILFSFVLSLAWMVVKVAIFYRFLPMINPVIANKDEKEVSRK